MIIILAVIAGAGAISHYTFQPTSSDDMYLGDGEHSAEMILRANNNWNVSVDMYFFINGIKIGIVDDVPVNMSGYKGYTYHFDSSYDTLTITLKVEIWYGNELLEAQPKTVTIKNGGEYTFYLT